MAADGHLRWGAPTRLFGEVKPEAVVHFAEHRSAPFSMIDQEHAVRTQINNVVGRLNVMFAIKQAVPDCHRTAMDTQTPTGKPTRVGVAAAARSALKGRVRPQWPRAPRVPHDEQTQGKSGKPPVVGTRAPGGEALDLRGNW
ncbi:MAG: UDP-sulfoquinovose synthase [Actinomycetota bacterium]|nr:UDP-sulfoquinovose synthase [Actinomycetota bacterium]